MDTSRLQHVLNGPLTAPPSRAITPPPASNIPGTSSTSTTPPSPFDVKDLVVVITGGGTGIGLMMARALERNGAVVYIVGRRKDVLDKAARENNHHQNLIPVECDVTNRESLEALVKTVETRHGFIDLLVNNHGVARNLYPHPLPSPSDSSPLSPSSLNQTATIPISPPDSPRSSHQPSIKSFQNALWNCGTEEDFAEVFQVNVTSVYYATVAFLDLLHRGNIRRRREQHTPIPLPHCTSQVISVSSSGSFRRDALVLSPSYTLSKAACTHLGKMMSSLLAPWGIRSNVLAPGVWPTDMTTSPTPDFQLSPDDLARNVPLGRVGTEEDMAGTILFLASRAGAYMNGSVLLTDGGRVGTVASTY